ncbi:hypothetical protein [Actinopolyspora halophila]|uniref:hypothetical protein n=1 Tax=Actinopolyspora halophila TaxID=1850 RepID=UPI0012FBCB0F|nr:hypothetical protein [Actinopolyspora halophila]
MPEQVAGECATLPREAREETFGDDGSGPRGASREQRDEYVTSERPSVGGQGSSREEQEPSSTEPDRTSAERDERAPAEQGSGDQERDCVEAPPGTRSLFAAVLAEIGRWRADVLK